MRSPTQLSPWALCTPWTLVLNLGTAPRVKTTTLIKQRAGHMLLGSLPNSGKDLTA